MSDVFLAGSLCHMPLLRVVLGRAVTAQPAVLPGYRVEWQAERAHPAMLACDTAEAVGIVLCGLSADDVARLDFHAACLGFEGVTGVVQAGADRIRSARFHVASAVAGGIGQTFCRQDWQAKFGAIVVATARDIMALWPGADPAAVRCRLAQMLVRGSSRLRADAAAPVAVRHPATAQDVSVTAFRQPYAHFFAIEEYDLAYRRFDRSHSQTVTRAVFVSGDAVTVLPYDPVRDRVLVIEQFRAGPFARGDGQPWQIEAIAGRIDPGETPEDCARREAVEEAALVLGALLPVAQYYPSPGAVSEYLYSYVALVDLPDGIAGVFGLEGEAEDIRGHLIAFDDLMRLVESGEAANAPLILTALWLQRERGRLRRNG